MHHNILVTHHMNTACTATHLIQQTPKRPNVTLEVISVLVDPLGTHVVRCANEGVSGCCLGAEEPSKTEVTQFHHALGCDEDVGWLDTSMILRSHRSAQLNRSPLTCSCQMFFSSSSSKAFFYLPIPLTSTISEGLP
ncbi:hypothetical protein E2C01_033137 [Portunus trituberculatus]|uniref:Uncharacterized protein n=1 Tax=Portunus trituberculatus TaxID=210409 RepID=A0A5B7F2N3_PORTR|nr:hypothetical protein [Portunus trituberculatus]